MNILNPLYANIFNTRLFVESLVCCFDNGLEKHAERLMTKVKVYGVLGLTKASSLLSNASVTNMLATRLSLSLGVQSSLRPESSLDIRGAPGPLRSYGQT